MKYVWTLLFLVLMSGTWYIANAESNYNVDDNARAEGNFAKMIVDMIKAKRPNVTDVHFLQLYTEVIQENKSMRAHFKYEIEEPTVNGDVATQMITGIAMLRSQDNGESWLVQIPDSVSDEINFKNGAKIIRGQDVDETIQTQITPIQEKEEKTK
jgi:hypothetical protein